MADRVLVDPGSDDELEPCVWTADELAGTGREYFDDPEAALEALPLALENRPAARELIATHDHDEIWIPNSRQYIAFAPTGRSGLLFVNRGFADVRVGAGAYARTEFPTFSGGSPATGRSARAVAEPVVCPVHHMTLPASGLCDDCG
ncbi:hypothetical protein C8046_03705 [Serinibacter arcticus]|uniref:Uncharacterized protein n=1 Tax=Serinibacter arcticus TaxID=1655435 RepID=A0A2U1ZSF9_9MICO|nr:hypothetical protein [Serinibacter arcticus]PWD49919.1 hypothetical protein C8046_03705 [Serinibacter arcticus]